ncbi:MAG: hypothetical protein EOO71_25480 [Myxococcaceae bacterium]|nr:MAG: hypothetical protein EOO71_25480 [Myxococcaceae bacterium]
MTESRKGFIVDEKATPQDAKDTLAEVKEGDKVRVTYGEKDGARVIQSLKVVKPAQAPQKTPNTDP